MRSYTFDEIKRIKEILLIFEDTITQDEFKEKNLELFEELQTLLTGIDNAKNFAKIGGLFFLLNHAFNNQISDEIRE